MAKIENESEKPSTSARRRRYEVLVSFNGLNQGDTFPGGADTAWEDHFVEVGYLRDLGEEETDVRSEERTS